MTDTLARITRDEYRRLPEGPPYYELVDGELIEMVRPVRAHYRLFTRLVRYLDEYAQGVGGELAPEPNLYLPGTEDVFHPDLVYVDAGNRGICKNDGIWGAPLAVCEILSPSTARLDRYKKIPAFRRAGVQYVWLIDPQSPITVEEYVLGSTGAYELHRVVSAPDTWEPAALPGLAFDLAELDSLVRPGPDRREP